MKLRDDAKLCQIGRCYDPNHPTCRSCQVGCALKAASKLPNLTQERSLSEKVGKTVGRKRQPNKTEMAAYNRLQMEYPNCEIRYEAITFHLEAGFSYTPDWFIPSEMLCVEVKNGAYRHASYGRSKLAYSQAAIEFPQFKFMWIELDKNEWRTIWTVHG